jgi:hypothetical protein
MKRWTLATAAVLGLIVAASVAPAMMIAPAPIPQRVATADMVVVGKVTGFGPKAVSAPRFPGDTEKSEYQIAIVRVSKGLFGAKDVEEIKVGFLPPPPPPAAGPPPRPGGPIAIGPLRKWREVQLALGQEGCMFLTKHFEGDFYVLPAYFSLADKKSPDFRGVIDEVEKCTKLLAEPKASLEAKKAEERFLTAGLLIYRYRMQRGPGAAVKQEPIDADESRLILKALAEADWVGRPGPIGLRGMPMMPQGLFMQLGVTDKDGWVQPKDYNKFPAAAKKWLEENAGKYRIQRLVPVDKKEKKDKGD